MPTSKKRKKKPQAEQEPKKSYNIVKSTVGKVIIISLALGFVLSLVISLVYTLIQAMTA